MFRSRNNDRRRRPDQAAVFENLRGSALTLDPVSLGLSRRRELPNVFGVVMDTTHPRGWATLVAVADGTTSLYTSTGGGIIGGGDHATVAQANLALLRRAEANIGAFVSAPGGPPPLPPSGHVSIWVLSYSGLLHLEAAEDDLGHDRHLASPVFHAAHGVLSALRLVDTGQAESSTPLPPGGATPLMAAAYNGDVGAVRRLVAAGAGLEDRDDDGYTALMFAANAGRDDVVDELLAHGADPNAADRQNSTPLMFAAQHDYLEIVGQLLAAGADPTCRGDHGLTALGFARQNGHDRTAEALIAAGGN